MPLFIAFFKSVLRSELVKFAVYCGLTDYNDVILHKKKDCKRKAVCSVAIFCAGVTDPDEFQRLLHGDDHNLVPGSDLLVKREW